MEIEVPRYCPVNRVELIHWDSGQVQINPTYMDCDIPVGDRIVQEVQGDLLFFVKLYYSPETRSSTYRSEGTL